MTIHWTVARSRLDIRFGFARCKFTTVNANDSSARPMQKLHLRIDLAGRCRCGGNRYEQWCISNNSRHEIDEIVRLSSREQRRANSTNKNQKTEMLQKARAALPLTKIRAWAFEGAFFSVTLIAMAGWVYFIALMLVKLFLWSLS